MLVGEVDSLRKARDIAKAQALRERRGALLKKVEYVKGQASDIEAELSEEPAPPEVNLRRDRLEGVIYLILATAAVWGVVFLGELSLRGFLPSTDFPLWWQRTVALIFALGTIVAFHFLITEDLNQHVPEIPDWLKWLGAGSFVTGLLFLAIIRGNLIGGTNQPLDVMRAIEQRIRWMGVISFVLLGLGVDVGAGLAGSFAWEKLIRALPLLRLYRLLRRAKLTMSLLEQEIAMMDQTAPPVAPASNSHDVPPPPRGESLGPDGQDRRVQ